MGLHGPRPAGQVEVKSDAGGKIGNFDVVATLTATKAVTINAPAASEIGS